MDDNSQPIDAAGVRAALERSGFPLEFQVARAFRQFASEVVHSSYYTDPVQQKLREIDVVATFGSGITQQTQTRFEVVFVVECKTISADDTGWALFTNEMTPDLVGLRHRVYAPAWQAWVALINSPIFDEWGRGGIEDSPIVANNGLPVTTSARQLKDTLYDALNGAVAAAQSYSTDTNFARVVFPVVVTDVPLFACSMDDATSEISVEPITSGQCPLFWRRRVGDLEATVVDIVTVDALDDYVRESARMARQLLAATGNLPSSTMHLITTVLQSFGGEQSDA